MPFSASSAITLRGPARGQRRGGARLAGSDSSRLRQLLAEGLVPLVTDLVASGAANAVADQRSSSGGTAMMSRMVASNSMASAEASASAACDSSEPSYATPMTRGVSAAAA